MPLLARLQARRERARAWDLAGSLREYLDRHAAVPGYTALDLVRAREKLDHILDSDDELDEWLAQLRGQHQAAGIEPGRTVGDFPAWLHWAVGVLVEAVRFVLEHPALVKFLLALLLAVVDERRGAFPLPEAGA